MRRRILPNLTIIFSIMCFVLYCIDLYKQGSMSFLDNPYAKTMHAVLCLMSFATAMQLILASLRAERKKEQQRKESERSAKRSRR